MMASICSGGGVRIPAPAPGACTPQKNKKTRAAARARPFPEKVLEVLFIFIVASCFSRARRYTPGKRAEAVLSCTSCGRLKTAKVLLVKQRLLPQKTYTGYPHKENSFLLSICRAVIFKLKDGTGGEASRREKNW